MNITIQSIPHTDHRYPTVGDWFFDGLGNLTIRVSQMSDWRREALVAVHELVEVLQCKQAGVTQEQVDWFDKGYEAAREEINPVNASEPGDSPTAPYHEQHLFATKVERELAEKLGVDWVDYEREVASFA